MSQNFFKMRHERTQQNGHHLMGAMGYKKFGWPEFSNRSRPDFSSGFLHQL